MYLTYEATITFELIDGDNIDAATAASLLGSRLFSEEDEIVIRSLSVRQVDA